MEEVGAFLGLDEGLSFTLMGSRVVFNNSFQKTPKKSPKSPLKSL